ncbi:hypothetical protein [Cellulomonas massiliensis]|uniref:hypothetical protein n=1 Tax=Cellulomonas massiliensis TaxID=1465811 RepID=UPI0002F998BA|nr:hypothetical protein [Cellulomonas massiliensis]
MLLADLQPRVRAALTSVLVEEWTLFAATAGTSHPSERTVAFQLGWHLRRAVDPTWSVDAEYDRSGMLLEDAVRLDGGRAVPNLIVHHRGLLGPEHNLLLVHVAADASAAHRPNLAAAQGLQRRFGYRYALVLDVGLQADRTASTVSPVWQWATLEDGPVTPEPVPVYADGLPVEVVARAQG